MPECALQHLPVALDRAVSVDFGAVSWSPSKMGRQWIPIGVVALMALAVAAEAQEPADGAPPADAPEAEPTRDSPDAMDEITVTGARSNVTDVQSESEAITAFDMEKLDRSNIGNVDALAFNVPALHIGQEGNSSIITLRGVSTENASPTGEPGVQFHVDGVNYARPSAARVAFFDLEGLQVLRGPQGSRGGKNSTAGWISVITRKPTDEFAVEGDVQWGAFNERRFRGSINLPLNEYAQTRFATYVVNRDGYQKNLFLRDSDQDGFDADEFGLRSHLRLLAHERLEALLTYNYYQTKGVGAIAEVVGLPPEKRCNAFFPPPFGTGYNPTTNFPSFAGCAANPERTTGRPAFLPSPIFAATGFDLDQEPQFRNFENPVTVGRGESRLVAERAAIKPHELYIDKPARQDSKFWGFAGTLDWEVPELPLFGETQLKSITAFQVTHPFTSQDADGTDLTLFFGDEDRESEQWSQELQWFGSSWEDRLDWQASLFWLHEKTDNLTAFTVDFGSIREIKIDQSTENKSYGAALYLDWELSEDFSIGLGGRYIKDKKSNNLLRDNPPGTQSSFASRLGVCDGPAVDLVGKPFPLPNDPDFEIADGVPDDGRPTCHLTFREVVGDITFRYWPTENHLAYFSVGNGFKSGGFALGESRANRDKFIAGFDPDLGTYSPEYNWAFTLGSKNTFFDDRLTLNVEGFFYNYRDQQLVLYDGLSVRTDNADSEMMGVDVEFDAEPLPGLRLDGFVSVLDTEFTEYEAVDPIDVLVATNCRIEARTLDPTYRSGLPGCTPTDYSGNELTRSPKLQYSIGVAYDIYLGRFGTLTPRVQYYWQDDTWFRPFNRTRANSGANAPCPISDLNEGGCEIRASDGQSILLNATDGRDEQEAYHFTDLKLSWTSPSETWNAEAFVINLEDQVVYQNLIVSTPILDSPQMAWYGQPRTYGFRIGFRF